MRRIMLLTLLALALPTAALANSFIPDDATTGNFISGSTNVGTALGAVFTTGPFSLAIMGTDGTLTLSGVTLRGNSGTGNCATASLTCRFVADSMGNFGTVTLTTSHGTFTAALAPVGMSAFAGMMTKTKSTEVDIFATLKPVAGVFTEGDLTIEDVVATSLTNGTLRGGIGILDVEPAHVPEPGTLGLLELGLLGNGVIGLVGMARRKLKLGT